MNVIKPIYYNYEIVKCKKGKPIAFSSSLHAGYILNRVANRRLNLSFETFEMVH